ncbi:hypothetical protein KY346_03745 [Candidatus Woesearchaeota archaeon]|nr:hypothetical protein [Candidatus Woesearchaeota archaeon]
MKKYKISIAEGSDERLKGALGYEQEHTIEMGNDFFRFFYENNLDDINAKRSSLFQKVKKAILDNKDTDVVVELLHHSEGTERSIASSIPFHLSMYALLVKDLMQELAPDASYSFTYTLENPKPNIPPHQDKLESTTWERNYVLRIGPGLDNSFKLVTQKKERVEEPDPDDKTNKKTITVTKIKTLSEHLISIKEVSELEEVAETAGKQGQETAVGTD